MNLRQLQQAKAAALDAAKAIQTAAGDRLLSAEEKTAFDGHLSTAEAREADIQSTLRLQAAERSTPGIEVGQNLAEKKPWENLTAQLKAVREAAVTHGRATDPRLYAATGANESVDAEGGFLIAPEYSTEIWQRIYDEGNVFKRCFGQPMSSNRLVLPAVDEDARTDGSRFGGIQSFWEAEAGTFTGSKPKFRRMELIVHKLTALIYGTDELVEDAPAWTSYCNNVVPQELLFKLEDAIYNGPGAGMPLGFMNSAALITVTKYNSESGKIISANDVFNMWAQRWGSDLVWFVNQDVESQLWNLTRGSGTAVELLYTGPGERGNNNKYGVMFGCPVLPVEYAATLGTPGDIVLANMSQYCLASRGETRMDTSIHVAFLTGEQAFRWQVRHDGQPFWKKPLTPKNGSVTRSPFIALATRS